MEYDMRLAWMNDQTISKKLSKRQQWLITGCAGFIGSNLVECLLLADQSVIGLDNLSTGTISNLNDVKLKVGDAKFENFKFIEADIRSYEVCKEATRGCDIILHQAALGSVPRSIANPRNTHISNVDGTFNIFEAARENNIHKLIFAASSSTYGDLSSLPKVENKIGKPLSPYAVTKLVNELYGEIFASTYDMNVTGLRYFNVFGARQSPNGAYAAVIPKWVDAMISGTTIQINGKGDTSRDFCYIDNVLQANIKAALIERETNYEVYNIAYGHQTSLNDLYMMLNEGLTSMGVVCSKDLKYVSYRAGDVLHSLADISKAKQQINYQPNFSLKQGLLDSLPWYIDNQFE